MTGTATVGGVFDVEQWLLASLANETTATVPLYVSYLLLAYDDIYDIYGQTSEVFRQPYASTVSGLFDMRHYFDDVVAGLPSTSRELLTPSYYAELITQPRTSIPRPAAPERSGSVGARRARARLPQPRRRGGPLRRRARSVDRLRSRGGDVTVRPLPGFDHVNSWIQAMPRAVTWFRSLD